MKSLLHYLHKKSVFGEIIHIGLNILLALAVFALVYIGDWAVYIAVLLVILSKWRIFAVRPRYWWANILANIVDITVSLSMVVLLMIASESDMYGLYMEYGVTALYILWLVVVKPRSSKKWVVTQAVAALFFGVWAIAAVSHIIPLWSVVSIIYIIGYGAARHVLSALDESEMSLISMVYGLIIGEVAWLLYHWNIAYGVKSMDDFRIPQMAIIVVALSLALYKLFTGLHYVESKRVALKSAEVLAPVVFSLGVVAVLLLFFSSHGPGII